MLLAASPTISADQKMQKVSANTITATSEDDFVLDIYGNANEDDTIDMRDLTYVKLIFFGKKPETELADAKYDGKINPLDFIQIKLIIVEKEKELTVVDSADRIVTVNKPVERIVVLMPPDAEAIQILNARDKVVGVSTSIPERKASFPELSKLPSIGTGATPDFEAILNLKPDAVLVYARSVKIYSEQLPDSIAVIGLDFHRIKPMREELEKLGYVLDKKNEAEEYYDWYEGYWDKIKSRTEGLSEDEKPRVYFGFGSWFYITRGLGDYEIAGGINIAADLEIPYIPGYVNVDPEWVVAQNPDIIDVGGWGTPGGYEEDDPSGMKESRDAIMNRPELANVNAVKNGKVYVTHYDTVTGPGMCIIGIAYYAKWFHPELFEDLDPQAIHQEFVDRFKRIDFNVYEHGVFVYPPLED